jgi:hypothetical protein
MSRFLHVPAAPVFLLLVTGCGPRESATAPKTWQTPTDITLPPTPVWVPDSTRLDQLDPPFDVGDYRIRPPKEYTLRKTRRGGTEALIWEGPERKDKSSPKLWVMVGKMAPGDEKLSLEESNAILIAGAKQKLEQYSETPSERGKIGDLPFLRMTFQGTEKGAKGHIVAYHAHDGQKYIHIMTMDVEPHWVGTFNLLETAARTIEKSKGEPGEVPK